MRGSNINSPQSVVDALAAGQVVDLEGPAWSDTGFGRCPDCGKVTGYFRARPTVRFYYARDYCRPHRCGKDVPWSEQDSPPKFRRMQARQAEQDALARRSDWPIEQREAQVIDGQDKARQRWLRELQYRHDRVSPRAAVLFLTLAVALVWGVAVAVYVGFFR